MHPFNNEQSALLHETIRNNARDYLRFYDLVKQSIKIKDLLENSRPFPGNNSAWQRTQAKKIMTFLDEISAGFTLWLRNLSNFPPDQVSYDKHLLPKKFLSVSRPISSMRLKCCGCGGSCKYESLRGLSTLPLCRLS